MEGYPQLKLPAQLFASVSVLFNQTPPSMYNNCCLSDHLYGSCERYFFFCQCCYRATSPWTLDVYWHSPRNVFIVIIIITSQYSNHGFVKIYKPRYPDNCYRFASCGNVSGVRYPSILRHQDADWTSLHTYQTTRSFRLSKLLTNSGSNARCKYQVDNPSLYIM